MPAMMRTRVGITPASLGRWSPTGGLLALPEPVPWDLFFDIEGARYYSEDGHELGLQYLFGIVDTGERGRPRYTQIWAFDRAGRAANGAQNARFLPGVRRWVPRIALVYSPV